MFFFTRTYMISLHVKGTFGHIEPTYLTLHKTKHDCGSDNPPPEYNNFYNFTFKYFYGTSPFPIRKYKFKYFKY